MALSLVKTATKVVVGVGAVYVTMDQGIWSNGNQGTKALDRVRTKVLPSANDYFQKVPNSDDMSDKVVNTWNSGVQKAFDGIAAAPDYVGEYSKQAVTTIRNNLTG